MATTHMDLFFQEDGAAVVIYPLVEGRRLDDGMLGQLSNFISGELGTFVNLLYCSNPDQITFPERYSFDPERQAIYFLAGQHRFSQQRMVSEFSYVFLLETTLDEMRYHHDGKITVYSRHDKIVEMRCPDGHTFMFIGRFAISQKDTERLSVIDPAFRWWTPRSHEPVYDVVRMLDFDDDDVVFELMENILAALSVVFGGQQLMLMLYGHNTYGRVFKLPAES